MSLPDPRRIISSHSLEDGTPIIKDDKLPMVTHDMGIMGKAYVQKGFPGDPALALDGATREPDVMWVQSTGISTAFLGTALLRVPLWFPRCCVVDVAELSL